MSNFFNYFDNDGGQPDLSNCNQEGAWSYQSDHLDDSNILDNRNLLSSNMTNEFESMYAGKAEEFHFPAVSSSTNIDMKSVGIVASSDLGYHKSPTAHNAGESTFAAPSPDPIVFSDFIYEDIPAIHQDENAKVLAPATLLPNPVASDDPSLPIIDVDARKNMDSNFEMSTTIGDYSDGLTDFNFYSLFGDEYNDEKHQSKGNLLDETLKQAAHDEKTDERSPEIDETLVTTNTNTEASPCKAADEGAVHKNSVSVDDDIENLFNEAEEAEQQSIHPGPSMDSTFGEPSNNGHHIDIDHEIDKIFGDACDPLEEDLFKLFEAAGAESPAQAVQNIPAVVSEASGKPAIPENKTEPTCVAPKTRSGLTLPEIPTQKPVSDAHRPALQDSDYANLNLETELGLHDLEAKSKKEINNILSRLDDDYMPPAKRNLNRARGDAYMMRCAIPDTTPELDQIKAVKAKLEAELDERSKKTVSRREQLAFEMSVKTANEALQTALPGRPHTIGMSKTEPSKKLIKTSANTVTLPTPTTLTMPSIPAAMTTLHGPAQSDDDVIFVHSNPIAAPGPWSSIQAQPQFVPASTTPIGNHFAAQLTQQMAGLEALLAQAQGITHPSLMEYAQLLLHQGQAAAATAPQLNSVNTNGFATGATTSIQQTPAQPIQSTTATVAPKGGEKSKSRPRKKKQDSKAPSIPAPAQTPKSKKKSSKKAAGKAPAAPTPVPVAPSINDSPNVAASQAAPQIFLQFPDGVTTDKGIRFGIQGVIGALEREANTKKTMVGMKLAIDDPDFGDAEWKRLAVIVQSATRKARSRLKPEATIDEAITEGAKTILAILMHETLNGTLVGRPLKAGKTKLDDKLMRKFQIVRDEGVISARENLGGTVVWTGGDSPAQPLPKARSVTLHSDSLSSTQASGVLSRFDRIPTPPTGLQDSTRDVITKRKVSGDQAQEPVPASSEAIQGPPPKKMKLSQEDTVALQAAQPLHSTSGTIILVNADQYVPLPAPAESAQEPAAPVLIPGFGKGAGPCVPKWCWKGCYYMIVDKADGGEHELYLADNCTEAMQAELTVWLDGFARAQMAVPEPIYYRPAQQECRNPEAPHVLLPPGHPDIGHEQPGDTASDATMAVGGVPASVPEFYDPVLELIDPSLRG
ncbi:hypothetical protein GQ53DRAFT_836518 [Thozetella sp. PMI_491]|nr:hypothetical protein GQ53DRAFT_836518 [Thozetella sp. PMI_491]